MFLSMVENNFTKNLFPDFDFFTLASKLCLGVSDPFENAAVMIKSTIKILFSQNGSSFKPLDQFLRVLSKVQ